MGLMDVFSKMNLATKGDPNKAIFAGLEGIGLKIASQEGAVTKMAGNYRGRDAAMVVDASKVMGANTSSLFDIAASVVKEVTGINRLVDNSYWSDRRTAFRARDRMQNAQIVLMWTLSSGSDATGSVNIGKDSKVGEPVGNGLFLRGDDSAAAIVKSPEVLSVLQQVPFDEIAVDGNSFTAFWAPPMSEYQKVVTSPDAVTATADKVLSALSLLCDKLS